MFRERRLRLTPVRLVIMLTSLALIVVIIWVFAPIHNVQILVNPLDGGVAVGNGNYGRFSSAQISAVPNQCYEFTGWTGNSIQNSSSPITYLDVNGNSQTVIANFERICIPPTDGRGYWEYFDDLPCYAKTGHSGESIEVTNNASATDPTWEQLKAFLIADQSDKKIYDLQTYACGAFAEEVHNNAEQIGIRAALAIKG